MSMTVPQEWNNIIWMSSRPCLNLSKVLDPNGREFTQPIHYNWQTLYCISCLLGHDFLKEKKGPENQQAMNKQQWSDKQLPT